MVPIMFDPHSTESEYCNFQGASKVFRMVNCFQQVTHGECGWSTGYCIEVFLIGTLALVNACLLSYLLYHNIRKAKQNAELTWHQEYLCKAKPWILIMGILYCSIQFIRNFLQPNLLGIMFNGTLYLC